MTWFCLATRSGAVLREKFSVCQPHRGYIAIHSLSDRELFGVGSENADWFLEVELICSDVTEHRNRVETRAADIDGHVLPTWQQVLGHEYEAWDRDRLVIDTAAVAPTQAANAITAKAADRVAERG